MKSMWLRRFEPKSPQTREGAFHKDPVLLSYLDSLPEGASIPRELYLIMAEILSYTYLLQGKIPEKWRREDGSIAIDRKI